MSAPHVGFPVGGDDHLLAQIHRQARAERIARFGPARVHANFVEAEQAVEQAHVPVRGAARADVAEHPTALAGEVLARIENSTRQA